MKKIISLISAVLFVVMLGSCDKVEEPTPNPEDLIIEKKVITRGGEVKEEPKEEVLLEATEDVCDFKYEANGKTYYIIKYVSSEIVLPKNETYDEEDCFITSENELFKYHAKAREGVDLSKEYIYNAFVVNGIFKVVKTTEGKYDIYTLYKEFMWHLEEVDYKFYRVIDNEEVKELTITLDTLTLQLKKLIKEVNELKD